MSPAGATTTSFLPALPKQSQPSAYCWLFACDPGACCLCPFPSLLDMRRHTRVSECVHAQGRRFCIGPQVVTRWEWLQWCQFLNIGFCFGPRCSEPFAPVLPLISYLSPQAAVVAGSHTQTHKKHTLPLPLHYNPKGQFLVHPADRERHRCHFCVPSCCCDTARYCCSNTLGFHRCSRPPSLPSLSIEEDMRATPFVWAGHVMWLCRGALDEKHNLQCPRLQQSSNPGWTVQLEAAVMLVS